MLSPPKSFAFILSFKGNVHKTLTTLKRQVLFGLCCHLVYFFYLHYDEFALFHDRSDLSCYSST